MDDTTEKAAAAEREAMLASLTGGKPPTRAYDDARHTAMVNEATMVQSNEADVEHFINHDWNEIDVPRLLTGFPKLDELLGGGLYAGVCTIGAISSLGKTTFMLQMVDGWAAAGRDVIIYALEMSRNDLIAKSISRTTYELTQKLPDDQIQSVVGCSAGARDRDKQQHINEQWASRELEITSRATYERNEMEGGYKNRLVAAAALEYQKYAKHVFVVEGEGDVSVKRICDDLMVHKRATGRAPIVVVDFLQLLASDDDPSKTDKQRMDDAVIALKRLAKKEKTFVILISSFNRANYNAEVNEACFKESGNIEYNADILIGMQTVKRAGDDDADDHDRKRQDPREIQVKVLKNRKGRIGSIFFDYHSAYGYFEPWSDAKTKDFWIDQEAEANRKAHGGQLKSGYQNKRG